MNIRHLISSSILFILFFFIVPFQVHAGWDIKFGANNGTGISSVMYATDAISSNDVWSVGQYYPDNNSPVKPLIEHWDGNLWEII